MVQPRALGRLRRLKYLDVSDYWGIYTGSYEVEASLLDDFSSNIYTSGSVSIGSSTSGNIETAGDSDWFSVYLTSGNTYQFDATESDYYLDLDISFENHSISFYLVKNLQCVIRLGTG